MSDIVPVSEYQPYAYASMNISHIFPASHVLRSLTPAEFALAEAVLRSNLGAHSDDAVVIVTDHNMLHQEGALWFETAKTITSQLKLIVLDGMTHSGQEPPAEVIEACTEASLSILHTTFSLTHTQAGKSAILGGGRGASLPGATHELIMRTLHQDAAELHRLGEELKQRLSSAQSIHITTEAGTNLTAHIRQHHIINDSSIITTGQMGNLPGGEVFFAPLPYSTNGTLVIDGSLADDVLDAPITVEIHNGKATQFSGGKVAQRLEKKLRNCHDDALCVAEIGIGTNAHASVCHNLLEAEKAYGTVHVAFGNSSAIGGEVHVPIHIDGLVSYPTVKLDGQVLLKNRQFAVLY